MIFFFNVELAEKTKIQLIARMMLAHIVVENPTVSYRQISNLANNFRELLMNDMETPLKQAEKETNALKSQINTSQRYVNAPTCARAHTHTHTHTYTICIFQRC